MGPLLATAPPEPTGTLEVALAHAARMLAARPDLAEAQALQILAVVRGSAEAWGLLAEARLRQGDDAGAQEAYAGQIAASVNDPELRGAAEALSDNRLAVAERLLKPFLKRQPDNVAALRMLAEVAGRIGRYDDAEACWPAAWSWRRRESRRGTTMPWCSIARTARPKRSRRWIGC